MYPEETVASTEALNNIASALRSLGNGDAATNMGAIEALSVKLSDALEGLVTAQSDIADKLETKLSMTYNYNKKIERITLSMEEISSSIETMAYSMEKVSDKWHRSLFPKEYK